MRWSGQELTAEEPSTLPGLARLNNLVRSVRTPEFADITFHEVLAKSALNKIPGGGGAMPFGWTINPYRGCSHACVYCLAPDTLILLADGRQRQIGEVRVGERIMGTEPADGRRRFVGTTVLAHWMTRKRAFRVTLSDGTELLASGRHRFLTQNGWRHVTGGGGGPGQRPHLTTDDVLMGFGSATPTADVIGAPVESDATLEILSIEDTGATIDMVDITTGTGDFIANGVVSHNCFARPTHSYLDLDGGKDFDREIIVKVNVAEVLRKELGKPSWGHHAVALGTNTDPYQRAEGRYALMPGVIDALADSGTPFSILTKGTLLRRDLDRIADASTRVPVDIAMSIAVYDDELQQSVEPGTPTTKARLATVTAVRDHGLDCSVFLMPILPYLTDTRAHLDEALRRAKEAGATSVLYTALHLKPGVKEWYYLWLEREHPELVAQYRRMYGGGAHAPKEYRRWLADKIRPLIRAHGLERGVEDPLTGGVRSTALGTMRDPEGERRRASQLPARTVTASGTGNIIAEEVDGEALGVTMLGVQPTLF